jgi:hypothetical protein
MSGGRNEGLPERMLLRVEEYAARHKQSNHNPEQERNRPLYGRIFKSNYHKPRIFVIAAVIMRNARKP